LILEVVTLVEVWTTKLKIVPNVKIIIATVTIIITVNAVIVTIAITATIATTVEVEMVQTIIRTTITDKIIVIVADTEAIARKGLAMLIIRTLLIEVTGTMEIIPNPSRKTSKPW